VPVPDHLPDHLVARLRAAGCVAAEEEAAALVDVARDAADLEAMVVRRTGGEPLAWVLGWVDFCGIRLTVHPGVYVPRWQSEDLARRAADLLAPGGSAVDLCTGAGALARVLQCRGGPVVATDIDPIAVTCARANGVDALLGDLDGPLPETLRGTVDVMTAVVPYVPADELRYLPRDVTAHEPRAALDGGPGGLAVLSAVVARSVRWLRPGGWLLLELGGDQAALVARQMGDAGFVDVAVRDDDDGDDRAIEGRLA
jgi:release factor glutamine methyltransferase